MDVKFDCDFRFADADVAVGTGWVQDTWDQKLLPEVGTLVQENLKKRHPKDKCERLENRQLGMRDTTISNTFSCLVYYHILLKVEI